MNQRIIIRPIITEKSMQEAAGNRYAFAVNPLATKGQIKSVIQETYGVEVISVKTAKVPGKRRRVGRKRREQKKPDGKKAYIELKSGQTIDIFETQSK